MQLNLENLSEGGKRYLFDRWRRRADYKWKLSYETIFETAKQIDKLIVDCMLFNLEFEGEPGNLKASDARATWQKKLLPPTRRQTGLSQLLTYLPNQIARIFRREP